MAKIFISYESSDKAMAYRICEFLEARELKCWIAPRDIHAGEYAGEIIRAIKSADKFVAVCSSHTSRSPHVKNEVSLAVDNRCIIIPFMLSNVALDDSLEYYFAGKQRIFVNGNPDKGFQELYEILGGETLHTEPAEIQRRSHINLWIPLVVSLISLSALAYVLSHKPNSIEPTVAPETVHEIAAASDNIDSSVDSAVTQKKQIFEKNLDLFSGAVSNGYPTGPGTYTFKKDRKIDVHDVKARVAHSGDYIVGEWENGHLIQGRWYSSDGTLIEVLLIGKAPDPESDHIFERCVKK